MTGRKLLRVAKLENVMRQPEGTSAIDEEYSRKLAANLDVALKHFYASRKGQAVGPEPELPYPDVKPPQTPLHIEICRRVKELCGKPSSNS